MAEAILPVVSVVVSVLTLAGLVALAILVVRRLSLAGASRQDVRLARIADSQRRLIRTLRPLLASGRPLDSAITRLDFAESLDLEQFSMACRESSLANLNSLLASRSSGVVLTVTGLRLLPSGAEMTVSASRHGQVLLAEGKAVIARHGQTGRALPILKNAQTGKIVETMKGVRMTKALSRLTAVSNAVIGAAHIIAGADIAKQLKQIGLKTDLLIAYRHIDQLATLERVYTSARELCSGPMTRDKCWELWRLRGELRQLRYVWRREFQHHLSLIDDPEEASWLKRTFTRQKTVDADVHGKITEGQVQLGLIEYSMRLDQVLAVGSGTVNEFERTLVGELDELETVKDLLEDKAGYISGKYEGLSLEPTVEGMEAIIEEYRRLLPDQSELPGGPAVLLPPADKVDTPALSEEDSAQP